MRDLVNIKTIILSCVDSRMSMADAFEQFVQFMENHEWFGMQPEIINQNGTDEMYFVKEDADFIHNNFQMYTCHESLSEEELNEYYLGKMKEKYPKTQKSFEAFIKSDESRSNISLKHINDICDFLLFYLESEICFYDDKSVEKFVNYMCDDLPITTGNYLLGFLYWIKKNQKVKYSIDYVLSSRNSESRTKQAYDSDMYLPLIYYLFNEDYINENAIYVKACDNYKTAETWLYLSIHMISSLRDTDIVRIPHPRLRKDSNAILELIRNGEFSDVDALLILNSVLSQLKNLPLVPSKSDSYSGISNIKLTIPKSAKIHFGTLFAIVESHRILKGQQTRPFIQPVKDYDSISKYLGDDIGDLFIYDNFSTRSANKSNMQAIEMFADDILDNNEKSIVHAKGYMLAALARSHKGSYGEFASSTEIYLKDANFSGYSAEFIAKELFEREVCSFIPSMMLKIITNREYDKLSITNQTKLIKEIGLSPNEIETFLSRIDKSYEKAKNTIINLFSKEDINKTEYILEILHNIGCGYAVSKEDDCLCLIMAMKRICPFDDKRQCIGCDYEISTTSTVYLLVNEFNRILSLRDNTDIDYLKVKYTKILKEVILPSINEIIICIKEQYGEEELRTIEQVIREVQNDY
jgi:hypothetical protein